MSEFVPLTGEPLAIDLINSRAKLPGTGWVDGLESLAGLRLWLRLQHERLDLGPERLTREDLTALRRLRDDAADVVAAARQQRRPAGATLDRLNQAIAEAPATGRLRWGPDRPVYETTRPEGAGAQLLAQLAEATAELVSDDRIHRVRDCAMPDCVMLFYASRPSRKWCTDAICGNRARTARHYRRHRAPRKVTVNSGDAQQL